MGFFGSIIGGLGSLFGGLFGANASSQAAGQYQQALQQAQQFMQDQEKQGLGNYQPYLQGGAQASGMLSQLLGTPGQGLLTPWDKTFQAPTEAEAEQTPGYQFQLHQGEGAIQNSAAAQGGLLSGGTLAGLNQYAQGLASTNYQNTFNNAQTQYQDAYQSFLNNQNNTYQRLMGMSGQGLQAAGGAGSLMTGMGGDIASLMGKQGQVQAAGTLGSANSILGMIPGLSGSLSQMFSGMNFGGGGGSTPTGIPGWTYGGAG